MKALSRDLVVSSLEPPPLLTKQLPERDKRSALVFTFRSLNWSVWFAAVRQGTSIRCVHLPKAW